MTSRTIAGLTGITAAVAPALRPGQLLVRLDHRSPSSRSASLGLMPLLFALLACLWLAPSAAHAQANATLAPGDGIRLRIFREPELSGEYLIDERGIVVLPKLGEWQASAVPADSVRGALRTAYQRYLATDAIEITPFRRVAVTGAVARPGLYPTTANMSISELLVLAGGLAENLDPKRVELRAIGAQRGATLALDQLVWTSGVGIERQLFVRPLPWYRQNVIQTLNLTATLLNLVWIVSRL